MVIRNKLMFTVELRLWLRVGSILETRGQSARRGLSNLVDLGAIRCLHSFPSRHLRGGSVVLTTDTEIHP